MTPALSILRRALTLICLGPFLISAISLAHAQTETVLYSFTGHPDASYPVAGVVRDGKGNLYGTTSTGGAFNQGAVFVVSRRGVEKVLYSFQGGTDGANPRAALILDKKAGNLYGTTSNGGGSTACTGGCGTIFKITTAGAESVLYSFSGGSDGANPQSSLVLDKQGNLYGTASLGGFYFWGTVFQLSPAGVWTPLYAFTGDVDGGAPTAGLVRDKKGNLYGTTLYGGSNYSGTVFKVTPSGNENVLYSFSGGSDGGNPEAGLVLDKKGNLYGTTLLGGSAACGGGCGTVFQVTPTGTESVLYRFAGKVDGGQPAAGLIQDKDGNLYGTTPVEGGSQGTVFEITAAGKQKVLYSFAGGTDGSNPMGGVFRDAKGNLYGTTNEGGAIGLGTVFKVEP